MRVASTWSQIKDGKSPYRKSSIWWHERAAHKLTELMRCEMSDELRKARAERCTTALFGMYRDSSDEPHVLDKVAVGTHTPRLGAKDFLEKERITLASVRDFGFSVYDFESDERLSGKSLLMPKEVLLPLLQHPALLSALRSSASDVADAIENLIFSDILPVTLSLILPCYGSDSEVHIAVLEPVQDQISKTVFEVWGKSVGEIVSMLESAQKEYLI